MTISLNLPADLEAALRARAAASGHDLPDLLIRLLQTTVGLKRPNGAGDHPASSPPPLEPGVYRDEALTAGAEEMFQAVPLPQVGTASVRFVPAGRLTPSTLDDAE